jgi:FG-GAP-like repeat
MSPTRTTVACLLLASFAFAVTVRAQEVLFSVEGDAAGQDLGASVTGIGDLNGDGIADVVACSIRTPYIRAFSGRDGTILFTSKVAADGTLVGRVGDVNQDGREDIIVGASAVFQEGHVYLLSGLDGSVLWKVDGDVTSTELGRSLTSLGDLDLDGIPDLAAGAPIAIFGSRAYVSVMSGLDGSEIYRLQAPDYYEAFGYSLGSIADLDGDGARELLVGVYSDSSMGEVQVVSGASGNLLYQVFGQPGDQFGFSLSGLSDLNGDGREEFIVGMTDGIDTNHAARVCSGKDGATIHELNGEENSRFGWSVGDAGDVNRDGVGDFIVGEPGLQYTDHPGGGAWLFSGKTGQSLYHFTGSGIEAMGPTSQGPAT